MIRHLFKTGHSTVLSLPKEVLDDLELKVAKVSIWNWTRSTTKSS